MATGLGFGYDGVAAKSMTESSNIAKRFGGGTHGLLKWLLLAFGAILFALLLRHYGTRETLRSLADVWPAIPIMVLIEGIARLVNAAGLRRMLPREGSRTPYLEVLRLTLEAETVNYLLPTASVGGNALLTRGLMRRSSLSESVVAVATAGSAQSGAQFLLVVAGSALALASTPVPAGLRPAIWAVMGLSFMIVCFFLLVLTRGVFVFLSAVLHRVHIRVPYLLERKRQVAALDESMRKVFLTRPGDLALAALLFACGWGVSAAELFVALRLMGIAFTWQQALSIHCLAVFIDGVVCFLPARAGSQEGGKILAFTAVGLPGGAGLIFGLLRRIREIVWALVGYVLLALRVRGGGVTVKLASALASAEAANIQL
jgi:hypothetical protein